MHPLATGQDWKSIKRRFHDVILKDLESKEYALEKNVIQRFRSNESSSSSERDSDIDEDKLVATSSVKPQKSVYVLVVFNRKTFNVISPVHGYQAQVVHFGRRQVNH